jgi:KUP system potassium uptake protein
VPGTAVFLNANPQTTPLALRANVERNHVLHESVVMMSVETERVAHVGPGDRLAADDLGDVHDGLARLSARFGFHDEPDVPAALRLAISQGLLERELDPDDVSYFLSSVTIVRTDAPGMSAWRKRLYLVIADNAATPVDHFRLPVDRTTSMGEQIEL